MIFYHINNTFLFIHSSIYGHLGYFHFGAIIMNYYEYPRVFSLLLAILVLGPKAWRLSRGTLDSDLHLKQPASHPGDKTCAISYFCLPPSFPLLFCPEQWKWTNSQRRVAWGHLSHPVFCPQPIRPRANDVPGPPLSRFWHVSQGNGVYTDC